MKRFSIILRLTFWLVATFSVVFLSQAQLGNKHLATTQRIKTSAHAIRVVDQNGQPAISGVPSGGGQTFDVAVGPGGGITFDPDNLNISVGDTVRWTWFSDFHSVTSGEPCTPDGQFCSPGQYELRSGNPFQQGLCLRIHFYGGRQFFLLLHLAL